jgi:hypothetical protein
MKARLLSSTFALATCLLVSAQVLAVEILFEKPVKIGDGQNGTIPTYGPGNQIVFDGNEIHVAWSGEDPVPVDETFPWRRNNEIRHVQSNDTGDSWERSDVVARERFYTLQGVSLALGSYQGNKYRHYAFGHRTNGNQVFYMNDTDGEQIDVTGGLGVSVDYLGRSIAADQAGNVFVCYGGGAGMLCSRFFTDAAGIVSLDPAETASLASGPGNTTYGEPAIAMDSSGNLYGAWSEQIDGAWELVLAKRVSAGAWEYSIIDRQGYEDYYTSIAIAEFDGTKKICVGWSYYEIVVSCTVDEGASWETSLVFAGEWADWRPGLAIASDGTVNVAWAHTNSESIKFARQLKDKKDTKWEMVEVDTQYYVMDVKLAVDADGLAHLVYPGKDWSVLMYTKEIPLVPTSPGRP